MKIKSSKAEEIDSWIKGNKCLETNLLDVELKGKLEQLKVYRLPIELLVYNKRNGRFAAEELQKEEELNRELDPSKKEDRKTIKELLLEEDENATQLLKENLVKVGQLHPGIITFDGVVINGNRRMAIFEDLIEETSDTQYEYLRVAKLPASVDEKDIYKLEIGLQLSRPYRKEYGPINELLKLQEGKKIGLTPKQIADWLFGGFKESDIKDKLERLKLIDAYLVYIEKPRQYEEVKGWHEHFIDLQNDIAAFDKIGMHKNEIHLATLAGFELITAKVPHMDVRRIKKLMDVEKTKIGLMESIGKVLKKKEDNVLKADEVSLEFIEDFENLKDTHTAQIESDKPKQLLTRAMSNLESIDPQHAKLKEPEIIILLENIAEIIKKLLGD